MNNFWARTITGLLMVFILLASLYISNWIFSGIFLVITILGLWEFYTLVTTEDCRPQRIYGTVAGAVLYCSIVLSSEMLLFSDAIPLKTVPIGIAMIIFFIPFILEIYRRQAKPLMNVAVTIVGIFYISFPLGVLSILDRPGTVHFLGFPAFLLGYFIITWFSDTGAYLYGKQFGRHKLFERISPKKTWEGTVAGIFIAFATCFGLFFLVRDIALGDWLVLACIVLIFGTLGDLAESLFKRSLNIKDSGSLLPGHGGILDRFDTIFLSAPFIFLYFILRNGI